MKAGGPVDFLGWYALFLPSGRSPARLPGLFFIALRAETLCVVATHAHKIILLPGLKHRRSHGRFTL